MAISNNTVHAACSNYMANK